MNYYWQPFIGAEHTPMGSFSVEGPNQELYTLILITDSPMNYLDVYDCYYQAQRRHDRKSNNSPYAIVTMEIFDEELAQRGYQLIDPKCLILI